MQLARALTRAEWQFAGGIAILIGCACAPSPRPTPLNFSGDWAATTSQGRRMTFTVSPDLSITALTIEYSFGGCSGSLSFSPNVPLTNTPGTAVALVTYAPNGPSGPGRAVVNFVFPSVISANGTVQFAAFPDCGSSSATWEAVKR
jgi:hypothetical protein